VKVLLDQRAGVISVRMTNLTDRTDFQPGHGLTGMRERIEALGGDLHVGIEDGLFVAVVCIPAAAA
jgi:glucose-6-phosphate-specific signal transduction histidine kinase